MRSERDDVQASAATSGESLLDAVEGTRGDVGGDTRGDRPRLGGEVRRVEDLRLVCRGKECGQVNIDIGVGAGDKDGGVGKENRRGVIEAGDG